MLLIPSGGHCEVQTLLARYHGDVLAIEDRAWHGYVVAVALLALWHVGGMETLSAHMRALEYPAGKRSRALMGYLPSSAPHGWEQSSWKQHLHVEVDARMHSA